MYKVSIVRSAALLIAAMFLGSSALLAAVPDAPEQLSGQIFGNPNSNTNHIQLTWFQKDHEEVTDFAIYVYQGESTNPNEFRLLTMFTISDTTHPDSSRQDTIFGRDGNYWYTVTVSVPVEHSYYVTSFNADGESDPSNIIFMKRVIPNSVRFTSYPVTYAVIDEQYTYEAQAEANDGSTITYELISAPQGMTVNSATGLIEWMAAEQNNTFVRLRATAEDGTSTDQTWTIDVRICAWPATILGNMTDQHGDNVKEGLVLLYPADFDFNNPRDTNGNSFKYPLRTDVRDGYFHFAVDKGEYVLQFSSQTYKNEWYEDVASRSQASIITVDCIDTNEVVWEVERLPVPGRYNVSGQVTWSTDGTGVPNARVDFIVMSIGDWRNSDTTDTIRNNGFWQVFSTYTDDNGNYSISLLDTYVYIARAISADRTPNTPDGPLFITQYYDDETDASEADDIKLEGDRNDIDFVVDPRPVYDNSISGVVQDEDGNGVAAFVIAFNVSEDPRVQYAARTTTTDDNFAYTLENLAPGEYVVFAIPQNRLHIPGYYKEGEVAVQRWMAATRIDVGETDDVDNITVILGERVGRIGNCIVDGDVRGNRSRIKSVDGGDNAQGDDDEQAIDGALVYIVDQNGVIVDYRLSDDQGAYSIEGIEQGVYTLVVDKIGFEPFEQVIEFEFDGAEINVEAPLAEAQVVSVDEPVSGAALNALAFPNPAAATVALKFEAQAGTARISVINSAGVEALSALVTTAEGVNVYRMNTNNLAAGMYVVRIESGVLTSEVSLRVVR